ncbi:MAG: YggS family pyridoxal phosphate-dependent enzyme [Candidatus Aminicenantes bacterium]|nr:YggS family pyridoxal phosphate-dependent enzyme [Candidatus Aminicenantes bacterium]
MRTVKENYDIVKERIEKACDRVQRKASDIKMLGVCKKQPVEKIIELHGCGVKLMGENRIQEAEIHQSKLNDLDIEWHFIGKLQKNKINKILKSFNFIQSVDGVKSLEHINKRVTEEIEVFIEINIGDEASKSGFTVEGLKKALDYISHLNKIKISGLMTIPPYSEYSETVRPFFKRMRDLKEELNRMNLSNFDIKDLSMGMSDDYEVAIEEGSTMLRIGTAFFGRRIQ